jgi:hypothetical protein
MNKKGQPVKRGLNFFAPGENTKKERRLNHIKKQHRSLKPEQFR